MSPKDVFRALRTHGALTDEEAETALRMVDDHNMSTHTYDEDFIRELAGRLRKYHEVMKRVKEAAEKA